MRLREEPQVWVPAGVGKGGLQEGQVRGRRPLLFQHGWFRVSCTEAGRQVADQRETFEVHVPNCKSLSTYATVHVAAQAALGLRVQAIQSCRRVCVLRAHS